MSIRGTITLVSIVLTALVLAVAGALMLVTNWMNEASQRLASATENVLAIGELEVNLLRINRERLLFALTRDHAHVVLRDQAINEINRWLAVSSRHIDDEAENAIYQDLTKKIYDAINGNDDDQSAAPSSQPVEIYRARLDEINAARDTLQQFRAINLKQADDARTEAAKYNRAADSIGLTMVLMLPVALVAMLYLVRRKIYAPFFALRNSFIKYKTEKSVRAPATGPVEVREIGQEFNEMADALARQRDSQLASLAAVAHDLRNPISALKVMLAVTERQQDDPEAVKKMLMIFKRQVDRLNRMVGDLLDVSLIENQRISLQFEVHDIREIVASSANLFNAASDKHEVRLVVPKTPVLAMCDAARMEQVFSNLVSNAIKYSPAGGMVEVAVDNSENSVVVRVRDQGVGIPPHEIPNLFQPFRRVGALQQKVQGVGLGLSVCKRLVEAHNGSIDVESSLGQGTTFYVRLPVNLVLPRTETYSDQLTPRRSEKI